MVQQTKLYGEAASASEETLSGISVVWAFNGQKQQIQKYNEKLNKVKVASNKAGLKIGLTRGKSEDDGGGEGGLYVNRLIFFCPRRNEFGNCSS